MKRLIAAGLFAALLASAGSAAQIEWRSGTAEGGSTKLVDSDGGLRSAMPSGSAIVLVKLAAADLSVFSNETWTAAAGSLVELGDPAEVGATQPSTGKVYGNYSGSDISAGDYVAAVLKDTVDGSYSHIYYYDAAVESDDKMGKAVTDVAKVAAGGPFAPQEYCFATEGNFLAAPEPSSAMLLMLGLAGLALKRKRA